MDAINIIKDFKGQNLNKKYIEIQKKLKEQNRNTILSFISSENLNELFINAKIIKDFSAQIDEIVHGVGMLNILPKILLDEEIVKSLSLGSSSEKDNKFDLVTNKRIAEFKFNNLENGVKGNRSRAIFYDYLNLLLYNKNNKLQKQLFVFNKEKVIKYLSGSSNILKKLSKNLELKLKFDNSIELRNFTTMKEIYEYSKEKINIVSIEDFL